MAVKVAVMPTAHDAVSPVVYHQQNGWPSQPLSPTVVDQGQYAHSPVGSVASPHSTGSPLSHANSPLGVCSPPAAHSPHVQAHSPVMQAGSPLHCQQHLSHSVNVKQELSGADYVNCNNLTHLLRGGPPDFANGPFTSGLNCHLGPPAQREILDGKVFFFVCMHLLWVSCGPSGVRGGVSTWHCAVCVFFALVCNTAC